MLRTMEEQLAPMSDEVARRLSVAPAAIAGIVDPPRLLVIDDALDQPSDYRQMALAKRFTSVTFGAATFHGIATLSDDEDRLGLFVRELEPLCEPTLTFFRQSPAGTPEPNYIHRDTDMGEWTAILYLSSPAPLIDGTTFWEHQPTGFRQSTATTDAEHLSEGQAWRDLSQWRPWRTVGAVFNRLLLFPARAFHSRAMSENFGHGDSARLIQVMFGRYRR